jgi:hypothetical protein
MIAPSDKCADAAVAAIAVMVCQNMFDHVILLIHSQVADIVAQWAVAANVSGLATPVA